MIERFNYVQGHEGILSVLQSGTFKPIICLSSTSVSRVADIIEKVNYCTQGKKKETVRKIDRTVSFDGEVMQTKAGSLVYAELITLILAKEELQFKLEGRGKDMFFLGVINSLSDSFGEGDATFSGGLTVNGDVSDTQIS